MKTTDSLLQIIKQHIPTWGPMQAPLPVDKISEEIVRDLVAAYVITERVREENP